MPSVFSLYTVVDGKFLVFGWFWLALTVFSGDLDASVVFLFLQWFLMLDLQSLWCFDEIWASITSFCMVWLEFEGCSYVGKVFSPLELVFLKICC